MEKYIKFLEIEKQRFDALLDIVDSVESKESFHRMMTCAFSYCSMSKTLVADELGFSKATIHRWLVGSSSPHMSIYPVVCSYVKNSISKKIEEIDNELRREVSK